jgi:hypothetical protein
MESWPNWKPRMRKELKGKSNKGTQQTEKRCIVIAAVT